MGHRSPGALFYPELNGNIGVKSKEYLETCRHFPLISARFQVLMWVLLITFWCSPCIRNKGIPTFFFEFRLSNRLELLWVYFCSENRNSLTFFAIFFKDFSKNGKKICARKLNTMVLKRWPPLFYFSEHRGPSENNAKQAPHFNQFQPILTYNLIWWWGHFANILKQQARPPAEFPPFLFTFFLYRKNNFVRFFSERLW